MANVVGGLKNQLGFKMVKSIERIELIDDHRQRGEGHGGRRRPTATNTAS